MPASALLLALAAAVVHASWNVLLARARDSEAATAVAIVVGVIAFTPAALLTWDVDADVWPYVLGSTAFELAYLALLAAAYARSELSLVYPLARGIAPVLVLIVGVAALGAGTSVAQVTGVCLVAVGLVMSPAALLYAATMVWLRGAAALRAEINVATIAAGVAALGSYVLALAALQLAAAAPVAAVRETSVVIAAVLAWVVLKEKVGLARLGGAALVVAGIALLGA
jgi:uncharacterized membrane protein